MGTIPMRILLLSTSIICMILFVRAMSGHFRVIDKVPKRKYLLDILGMANYIIFLKAFAYSSDASENFQYLLAESILLVSLVLFLWTRRTSQEADLSYVFSDDIPQLHLTKGPYLYIRHPFYTSYLAFWIGLLVYSFSMYSLALTVIIFVLYRDAASDEERKFMHSGLSFQYSRYKRTTGMFLPKLMTFGHKHGSHMI